MGQMSDARVAEFVKELRAICPSKHSDEVFRDFSELAFCALAKVASPWPDQREKLETQYMEVVGRYRNKDDIRAMPALLTIVLAEIGKGGIDFLGQVAGEIGALNNQMGQFFTPYEVSRMMAEVSFDGVDQIIEENGFVTVQEPAAGAGGMLLAMADVIEAKGFNLETQVWIEATELSRSTFHMCYVQCAARGLAGRIINGNSLSAETYEIALTGAVPVFYRANGDPFARQRAAKEREAAQQDTAQADTRKRLDALRDAPPIVGDQLSLF